MFDGYVDDFVHPTAEPQDDIVITDTNISTKPQISAVLSIKEELIEDMEQDMEQNHRAIIPSVISVKQLKADDLEDQGTPSSSSSSAVTNRSDASNSSESSLDQLQHSGVTAKVHCLS
jgi:hypothetical protein